MERNDSKVWILAGQEVPRGLVGANLRGAVFQAVSMGAFRYNRRQINWDDLVGVVYPILSVLVQVPAYSGKEQKDLHL